MLAPIAAVAVDISRQFYTALQYGQGSRATTYLGKMVKSSPQHNLRYSATED